MIVFAEIQGKCFVNFITISKLVFLFSHQLALENFKRKMKRKRNYVFYNSIEDNYNKISFIYPFLFLIEMVDNNNYFKK